MRRVAKLLLCVVVAYLAAGLAAATLLPLAAPGRAPALVVVNYRRGACRVLVETRGGRIVEVEAEPGVTRLALRPALVRVSCGPVNYTLIPLHNHTVYVLIPPFNYTMVGVRLGSYSLHDAAWRGAPPGLAVMTGLWGVYVEEETAGRLFNMYYDADYKWLAPILSKAGIHGGDALEIAATAMWACQLAREVREEAPNPALEVEALHHIGVELGLPGLEVWGSPILLPASLAVHYMSEDEILEAVLAGVKSIDWYVAQFPSWRRVDTRLWLRLCHAACNMTVKPIIPTYVHVLVAGAILYSAIRSPAAPAAAACIAFTAAAVYAVCRRRSRLCLE